MIRNHLHFLLIIPALIIVMTWPTFYYVFEMETFWLPSDGTDIWLELWEVWYGIQILSGKADLFYTDLLFILMVCPCCIISSPCRTWLSSAAYKLLLPVSNAFSLSILLTLFANALATYVCVHYVFKDKWISLFGAALIGIGLPFQHGTPLEITTFVTVPLSIYFLHRAIYERKWRFALFSGVAVGMTATLVFIC